jgi:hypothetical protein
MDSDHNEYLDHCEDLANAHLCDTAEPKPEPDYSDIESDGVF